MEVFRLRRRTRWFVEPVLVEMVDVPVWVVVGFIGMNATAAPTTRMARIATPAKSGMLRSMGVPSEPSVVKTTHENTPFRLLEVSSSSLAFVEERQSRSRSCGG